MKPSLRGKTEISRHRRRNAPEQTALEAEFTLALEKERRLRGKPFVTYDLVYTVLQRLHLTGR